MMVSLTLYQLSAFSTQCLITTTLQTYHITSMFHCYCCILFIEMQEQLIVIVIVTSNKQTFDSYSKLSSLLIIHTP